MIGSQPSTRSPSVGGALAKGSRRNSHVLSWAPNALISRRSPLRPRSPSARGAISAHCWEKEIAAKCNDVEDYVASVGNLSLRTEHEVNKIAQFFS